MASLKLDPNDMMIMLARSDGRSAQALHSTFLGESLNEKKSYMEFNFPYVRGLATTASTFANNPRKEMPVFPVGKDKAHYRGRLN